MTRKQTLLHTAIDHAIIAMLSFCAWHFDSLKWSTCHCSPDLCNGQLVCWSQ